MIPSIYPTPLAKPPNSYINFIFDNNVLVRNTAMDEDFLKNVLYVPQLQYQN